MVYLRKQDAIFALPLACRIPVSDQQIKSTRPYTIPQKLWLSKQFVKVLQAKRGDGEVQGQGTGPSGKAERGWRLHLTRVPVQPWMILSDACIVCGVVQHKVQNDSSDPGHVAIQQASMQRSPWRTPMSIAALQAGFRQRAEGRAATLPAIDHCGQAPSSE